MTTQEINELSKNLRVGDRFYYTGDMANRSSFGTIVARIEDPKWGLRYSVEFDDDGRTSHSIMPASFTFGPGQRFKTMSQYDAERAEATERFEASIRISELRREIKTARKENEELKAKLRAKRAPKIIAAAANDTRPVVKKKAPKTIKIEAAESNETYHVDVTVEPGKSIVLSGKRPNYEVRDDSRGCGRHAVMPFHSTYHIGDSAAYDGYNFTYFGNIVSIGKKTVTIEAHGRNRRLTFKQFAFWNRRDPRFDHDDRANWMD